MQQVDAEVASIAPSRPTTSDLGVAPNPLTACGKLVQPPRDARCDTSGQVPNVVGGTVRLHNPDTHRVGVVSVIRLADPLDDAGQIGAIERPPTRRTLKGGLSVALTNDFMPRPEPQVDVPIDEANLRARCVCPRCSASDQQSAYSDGARDAQGPHLLLRCRASSHAGADPRSPQPPAIPRPRTRATVGRQCTRAGAVHYRPRRGRSFIDVHATGPGSRAPARPGPRL